MERERLLMVGDDRGRWGGRMNQASQHSAGSLAVPYPSTMAKVSGNEVYGAKCHICSDVLGSSHDVEPTIAVSGRACPRCSFCQERTLTKLIQQVGLDVFDPEVRTAVKAFRAGKPHPLIDQLRAEIQAEEV